MKDDLAGKIALVKRIRRAVKQVPVVVDDVSNTVRKRRGMNHRVRGGVEKHDRLLGHSIDEDDVVFDQTRKVARSIVEHLYLFHRHGGEVDGRLLKTELQTLGLLRLQKGFQIVHVGCVHDHRLVVDHGGFRNVEDVGVRRGLDTKGCIGDVVENEPLEGSLMQRKPAFPHKACKQVAVASGHDWEHDPVLTLEVRVHHERYSWRLPVDMFSVEDQRLLASKRCKRIDVGVERMNAVNLFVLQPRTTFDQPIHHIQLKRFGSFFHRQDSVRMIHHGRVASSGMDGTAR